MADTLPTELIERILGFAASINTHTGHAVCSTNRLGRRAGTPVLYDTLEIRSDDQEREQEELERFGDNKMMKARNINNGMRKWSLLCRTVLANRVLARRVRVIKAHLDYIEHLNHLASRSLHHNELLKFVGNEMMRSPVNSQYILAWLETQYDRAQTALRHEDGDESMFVDVPPPVFGPEVYLSILVLACPRLQSLNISGPTTSMLRPINELGLALQRRRRASEFDWTAEGAFGGFSSVREVTFGDQGTTFNSWAVEHVGQALRWPSIQKMTVQDLRGGTSFWTSLSGRKFQSTLTTLYAPNAGLDIDELRVLLCRCNQLKKFGVSWNDDYDVYRCVDWRELATTLIKRTPLLEEFHVDVAHEADLREVFMGEIPDNFHNLDKAQQYEIAKVNHPGLGSLAGLKHLRKLSVPYFALYGVFDNVELRDHHWTLAEILPGNLEELKIYCEDVDFKERDMALLTAPGTEELRMAIWNCTRDKWMSKVPNDSAYRIQEAA